MAGSNKRILLTGASGYVGQWVHQALITKGYTVSALKADITDKEALQRELLGTKYSAVIHLAGSHATDADELRRVNIDGTKNLLDALAGTGLQQFIFMSSIHVYGPVEGTVDETYPAAPLSEYGRSKLTVEHLLHQRFNKTDAKLTILRASNAYGAPKQMDTSKWSLLFNDLCKQAYQTNTIQVKNAPNKTIDMVWMGHVVDVLLNTLDGQVPEAVLNLCSGKSVELSFVAEQVQQAWKQHSGRSASISYGSGSNGVISKYNFDRLTLDKFVGSYPPDVFKQEALAIFRMLDEYKQITDS